MRKKYGSNSENIVVHYRKGDSGWAVLYNNYYIKIKKLLKEESSKIIIVTDSKKEALDFFKELIDIDVVSSDNAIEDFKILLSAKKLYCAPSTFSWWASHSLSREAQVVFPSIFENTLGVYLNKKRTITIN